MHRKRKHLGRRRFRGHRLCVEQLERRFVFGIPLVWLACELNAELFDSPPAACEADSRSTPRQVRRGGGNRDPPARDIPPQPPPPVLEDDPRYQ